ncbi:hypothetical protein KQI36_01615 [Clostridium senegalense]|nr:hypothetical protein [Clostridium senegalense]
MKNTFKFLSDKKILLGIGIGILIGAFCMTISQVTYSLSDSQVEMRARKLGMKYPDEVKVMINKDEVKK